MAGEIFKVLQEYPFLTEIFDSIGEYLGICDENGCIVFNNKAQQELDGEGFSLEEVQGTDIRKKYHLTSDTSPMLSVLETKQPLKQAIVHYKNKDKQLEGKIDAIPIYIKGKLCGAFTIQSDYLKIKKVIEHNIDLQKQLFNQQNNNGDTIIGEDEHFLTCKKQAQLAAINDSNVMLIADTGCGKEVFAHFIHNNSERKNEPFLALNCAAIPETLIESILFGTTKGAFTGSVDSKGLFEQAEGGTLFLDEINSMPLASQAKLLRVLEDRTVQRLGSQKSIRINVRIISSCNIPEEKALKEKALRHDLFYRLAVICIKIPPLAERKNDIYLLANHFISKYNQTLNKQVLGLDDSIVPYFLKYSWPGNVRQLKHCIESAMNFVEEELFLKKEHVPSFLFENNESDLYTPESHYTYEWPKNETKIKETVDANHNKVTPNKSIREVITEKDKEKITQALIDANGNITKAAQSIGLGRGAFIYRMKKYHIE